MIHELIDRFGTQENHLASCDYADELATVGEAIDDIENVTKIGAIIKLAFAIGYEARKAHENQPPLDRSIWNTWE